MMPLKYKQLAFSSLQRAVFPLDRKTHLQLMVLTYAHLNALGA
jgi:hypothetical protein